MSPPLVLVADDELDIRTLVSLRLQRLPIALEIVEAEDGDEALMAGRERGPDLVVLDHRMPGMTGAEVAKVLRDENPDLPIAIFSAFLHPELREEVEASDVACFAKTELEALTAWVTGQLTG